MSKIQTVMSIWDKPVFSREDVLAVMPGKGRGVYDLLIDAEWIAPCPGPRPFFDSAKVRLALQRMANGEQPKPIWRWKRGLMLDSMHLVRKGRAACGCVEKSWLDGGSGKYCTRCEGRAKTLRVEE